MKKELCAFSPSQDERSAPRYGSLGCVSVTARAQLMF